VARQPSQNEIQPLLNLYHSGQLLQLETAARALLKNYPGLLIAHNLLGVALEGQGKFAEAADCYRKTLQYEPRIAEIHFNLGAALANLGKTDEAIKSYRRAIELKPNLAVAHFNLGLALQAQGKLDEAITSYRKAISLEPGFFDAYGSMGTALQAQGKLDEAIAAYRKGLAIQQEPRGHFNLATALRDQGKLDEAVISYKNALAMNPNYSEAYNNLGETLRDQGNMEEAVRNYHHALVANPNNTAASFNIAQFLYDAGRYEEAIPHFEKSQREDWRERTLYCLYKTQKYEEFREKLQTMIAEPNILPFLANLSAHYAANFGMPDEYNFCRNPLGFVYHGHINELTDNSGLLDDLLRDVNFAEIAERKQGRLYHGIQSAGNLFKRPEESFRKLGELVRQKVREYGQHFADQDCIYIKEFPQEPEFSSSWYVKMNSGGHLTSHIHETGWLSGVLYLAIPPREAGSLEGCIEFSMDGDNYPKQHDNFASMVKETRVGDIILFPSSLFHRTIPFSATSERICVAFDIKPKPGLHPA
jgi:uncharacterized protein (TIGR02466 family)